MDRRPVVTFDLFSALLDSRQGASATLARLGTERGWDVDATAVYDRWDAATKQAHRDCGAWVPHVVLAREALARCYAELGVAGDPDADVRALYASLPDWPLWPDVARWLPPIAEQCQVGILSNTDDALFVRTRAAPYVDARLLLTSERLQAYKPDARIYERARQRFGGLLHVATSARDVRGALEAGLPVVRLRRPGHQLDPAGPEPAVEAEGMEQLAALLPAVAAQAAGRAGARGKDPADSARRPANRDPWERQ